MGSFSDPIPDKSLRKRAEERLESLAGSDIETLGPEEIKRVVNELQVHQIELEIQNEELRRSQLELEATRTRYFSLYELMPVGYCTLSDKGIILEANLTATTLLGVARAEMINKNFNRFIFEEDQDIFYLCCKQLLADGVQQSFDLRLKRDNTVFWARIAIVFNDSTEKRVILTVLHDITEHKLAAEDLRNRELRKSEQRFRKLFEQHSAIKLIIDAETGLIVDVNKAAIQYYGWPIEVLKRMSIQEINILPPETLKTELMKVVLAGSGTFEFRHRKADASIRDVEVFTNKIEVEGRDYLYSIIHDITDRKQFEIQLRTLNDELERRVEQRTRELLHIEKLAVMGSVCASVAHEFNNPLQGIMAILKSFKKTGVLAEKDSELLDVAIEESERMKNLILNFKELSRPSLGHKVAIDVKECMNSMLLLCKGQLKRKKISTVLNYFEQIPQILAIRDQIKQVFLNLLNNAVDAIQQGGVITITTCHDEKIVAVTISDNGIGFNPEEKDRIFEPFYTTKSTVDGTGLGLSVVHRIVKDHHGVIRVESEPGKGSAFTVLLPIK